MEPVGTSEEEPLACAFYINACFERQQDGIGAEVLPVRLLPTERLRHALAQLQLEGTWWLSNTPAGLVLALSRPADAHRLFLELKIAQVLEGPVQVATLPAPALQARTPAPPKHKCIQTAPGPATSCPSYPIRQCYIVRDVPWSIPCMEICTALGLQGVRVVRAERWRQHVRVELQEAAHCDTLLAEGCDFFGVSKFAVAVEHNQTPAPHHHQNYGQHPSMGTGDDGDVLQCYRCQGFWHMALNCRQMPRCVRCGEPHAIECCPRPRNNPICCNCLGTHHAAYKFCPIRKQMSKSVPVYFTLSTQRPPASAMQITPDVDCPDPRCLL